jgi:transcription initiation factor TFIID subunit 1
VEKDGERIEQEYIETDPAVIKQYMKMKEIEEAQNISLSEIAPTGDADFDARQRKRLEEALAKLEKNAARRKQRTKNKAALATTSPGGTALSPDADGGAGAGGGGGKNTQPTQRKCANCGQVGHIKTNKKLCPLLNGTIKQEEGYNSAAFMGAPPSMS